MGDNLFSAMLNAIKARFTGIVTKLRMFTRKDYWRTRVIEKLRHFFQKIFDVKPRDKDDYYSVFGWMISKKLAFAIVIIVGVLSLIYAYATYPALFPHGDQDNLTTYAYNSPLLRFAKGNVRIKGKSKYVAYEGEVAKGKCTGQGTLYNPQGNIVYQGNFVNSMYDGQGTFYYADGTMHYIGGFEENLFSGEGTLYRSNGSMEYVGEFARGMKEGKGSLYDTGANKIFDGSFAQDEVLYSSLIGLNTQEVAAAYTGAVVMYDNDAEHIRCMKEIDAITVETSDEASVKEGYTVDSVYVMKQAYRLGGEDYETISDLIPVLGQPTYEGLSRATLPEVIAIHELPPAKQTAFGVLPNLEVSEFYTEYSQVTDYDLDYEIYLVSFQKDGLVYNFVTGAGADKDKFSYYYILQENSEDAKE